jgi:hypothetical protein
MADLDHCDFGNKPVWCPLSTAHALIECSSGIHFEQTSQGATPAQENKA